MKYSSNAECEIKFVPSYAIGIFHIKDISLVPQGTNFIEKDQVIRLGLFLGGEGETRTPAPVTRPTPLAGAPRHQLEYFSMVTI